MLVTKALALTGIKVITDDGLFEEVRAFFVFICVHLDTSACRRLRRPSINRYRVFVQCLS